MFKEGYSNELPSALLRNLRNAANALRRARSVTVVSHIDADGITAGAIASQTLSRLGILHELHFEKKIAPETVEQINSDPADIVWVCDLGSAYMSMFTRNGIIVTDHHTPDPKWRSGQTSIDSFGVAYNINPHLYGVSGSYAVCGAGMTYLLSRTIDPANKDLAYLAVIGAIGDFQDTRESGLISWNDIILKDAVEAGDVECSTGLRYFGRFTRPLIQFLQYGEPAVPGLTGDCGACLGLLERYGIQLNDSNGAKRSWADLQESERMVITDEILGSAASDDDRRNLFGEIYTVLRYEPKTGLRDAKEFATTLNSCGRYDDAETGARICMGDIDALKDAEHNRREHRKNISYALSYVKDNHLLRRRKHVQYFDAGSSIRETVVGIVAGMVLSSSEADPHLPILAFAEADDGVKVSARASKELTRNGLDLSKMMCQCAAAVGGFGGGHNVAAGATIPKGMEEVFLDKVEEMMESGLSP